MNTLRSKLPSGGVSIFAVMTRLANEVGAINLSQGFPDFETSPELIDTVARYMREGHNQYAPMPGVAGAARGALDEDRASLRPSIRSCHRDHCHDRRDRSAVRRADRVRSPGRRGAALPAGLRLIPPAVTLSGGTPGLRHAPLPRLSHRLGRGTPRRHSANAGDRRELAAQSNRDDVVGRRRA